MKTSGKRKVATFTNGSDGLRAQINDGKWTIVTRMVVSGASNHRKRISERQAQGLVHIRGDQHSEEKDLGDLSHSQH